MKMKNSEIFMVIMELNNMLSNGRRFKGNVMYAVNKNLIELKNKYEPCEKTVGEIVEKYNQKKEKEMKEIPENLSEEAYKKAVGEIEKKYIILLDQDKEIKEISDIEVEVELKTISLSKLENYDFSNKEMNAISCMIEED